MKTKYQKVADDLLRKILDGSYAIGQVIPTEHQLCDIYQVSRHTVRQALSLLIQQGYLKAEKGSGTFVLDYKDNQNARTVATKTIGVITTYLSDYIFPNIIEGIEEVLRESGYSLMLSATNNNPALEEDSLKKMMAQGVEGFLIEPTSSNEYNPNIAYYAELKEAGIPVYFLNAYYDILDIPYASLDDFSAGYEATKYLIDRGHRKIGLITKLDDMQGKLRMKGFVNMHEAAKLSFRAADIATFTTKTQQAAIRDYVEYILKTDDAPTAFVCYNDQVSSQFIQLMKEKGREMSQDYSIISHDNSYLAEAYQLTSISHPKQVLGRDAAKQLLGAIERKKRMKTIHYPAEVIERSSVK
ncbi:MULTISPECIES: GntR family transcriptional regulator [Streptococcus]|uniref:GntR family transcriptional regulator n=1 Tax=Streptococcus caledonicus TaxID=2614158 RepID=A0ABW0UBB4_9STRE|nr:GntR family transcriptional regulator [Streptococcus sp. S784/96/1]